MTASQIIGEIVALPPSERAEVIRFARSMEADRLLSGNELAALAAKLVSADDSTTVSVLRESIERGFYGGNPHA